MKVWEIKTHRHGALLFPGADIHEALAAYETFAVAYFDRTKQKADEWKDSVYSCICLGEVVKA